MKGGLSRNRRVAASRSGNRSVNQGEELRGRVARLYIELLYLEPAIWRRIDVPLSMSLENLNEAIQKTLGWDSTHLWDFEIDGRRYADPKYVSPAWGQKLHNAINTPVGLAIRRGAEEFIYTYDFGDNWQHEVTVENVFDGEPDREYPAFVDGAMQCPPEDIGGVGGFEKFLRATVDPEHEWQQIYDRDEPFDPTYFDKERARLAMENVARIHRYDLAHQKNRSQRRRRSHHSY